MGREQKRADKKMRRELNNQRNALQKKVANKNDIQKANEKELHEYNMMEVVTPYICAWSSLLLFVVSDIMIVVGRYYKEFALYFAIIFIIIFFAILVYYLFEYYRGCNKKQRQINSRFNQTIIKISSIIALFANVATALGYSVMLTEKDNSIATFGGVCFIAIILAAGAIVLAVMAIRRYNKVFKKAS